MSNKRRKFSNEFKVKLVLEVLKNEKPINQIAKENNISLDFYQSNHEGKIIEKIHEILGNIDAIIINAAAYTHTSIAIHDALKMHKCPVIEVHLSSPKEREKFRHFSYIEPLAKKIFSGYGEKSYYKALNYAISII